MRAVVACVAATCVWAGVSLWAGVAGARTVAFDKLPLADVSIEAVADTPPASVPATSHVDGFHVAPRTYNAYYAALRAHEGDIEPSEKGKVCFAESATTNAWVPDELQIYAYRPVTAVRSQRLLKRGKRDARLLVVDAWVDVNSGGTQRIAEHEVALKHVNTASTGVKVFAARDADGETVHFVVRRAPRPKSVDDTQLQSLFGFQQIVTFHDQSFDQSSCDWTTVSMKRKRTRDTTATVRSEVVLRATPREEPVRGVHLIEVRLRPMYAHLSVTQSKSDARPVASVSFGWAGKGATQQIPLNEPDE